MDYLLILVIAAAVQFTEMVVRTASPLLHQVLGIYLPLITTSCAVLGVALLNVQAQIDVIPSLKGEVLRRELITLPVGVYADGAWPARGCWSTGKRRGWGTPSKPAAPGGYSPSPAGPWTSRRRRAGR